MPRLSVWAVRAALLHLLIGFTVGGLLLANKGVPFLSQIWLLLPSHTEFLLVGWTAQFAFGVAFWILPRFHGSRGNETLAATSFVFINFGVLLVVLQGVFPLLLLLGRLAELAAVIFFLAHAWGRIKPLWLPG